MRVLALTVLAGLWVPGLGFAQSFQIFFYPPPAPPDLVVSSAGFTRANQDFVQSAATWPCFEQAILATVPVPSETWEAVRKLSANKKIRVVTGDLERIKGRFISATTEEITFRMSEKSRQLVTIPRNDVRMLSIRHSKAKMILASLLVGALVGAVAVADASNDDCWSCCCDERDSTTGTDFAVGAAAGAAVFGIAGALAEPTDEVVYSDQSDEAVILPAATCRR
jgi:hypothetical protein